MDSWSHRPFGLRSSRVPVTSTSRVSASSSSSLLGSTRLSSREVGLSSDRYTRTSTAYKTDLDQPVSWTHSTNAHSSQQSTSLICSNNNRADDLVPDMSHSTGLVKQSQTPSLALDVLRLASRRYLTLKSVHFPPARVNICYGHPPGSLMQVC